MFSASSEDKDAVACIRTIDMRRGALLLYSRVAALAIRRHAY